MGSPKVTVTKTGAAATPTDELVSKAAKAIIVKDARGRSITIRNPGVLAQFRLVEALGAETSKNETYMGMILPLIYIGEIDGEVITMPSNKLQIEALIQRLDDDGITAVTMAVMANFGPKTPDEEQAAIKK